MIVSFDLDDTLFVSPDEFKTEAELKFPFNKIYKERLRLGTISLFQYIKNQGIQLWIYTTSFRTENYIRNLFRCYGVKIDSVVNGERHAREVQGTKSEAMPSKYPSKYRIDLHIDDDISVAQNGRTYGFRVFIVGKQDDEWDKKIIQEIEKIKKRNQPNNKENEFPFADAPNTASMICRHVMAGNAPILYVSHDEDDGMWQFLCGCNHEMDDARVVSLYEVFMQDSSVGKLADMPCGCVARRKSLADGWIVYNNRDC